ncbi:MAG: flagellar biosynthesis protein FliQ, partial [Planctomycetaceae bacterium]
AAELRRLAFPSGAWERDETRWKNHYMGIEQVVDLGREAIFRSLMIGAPIMITALVVGLVISFLQAITQIQDQTLTMVPKIVLMMLALLYTLPWIIGEMTTYSTNLITNIPAGL